MKKIKYLATVILLAVLTFSAFGCYAVSGQKMKDVKGTYKLTYYSYTPKHERKSGYTPNSINYIEDERYLFEDYLIITGTNSGYYVHKQANAVAYSKEITLSYLYDDEDSSKVEYVIYNDALSVNSESGANKLGILKNNLNYTKTAIDYTELFTKRPMRTEAMTIRWNKVDKAIDLSYAQKQLGSLKEYDYKSFGVRGVYELSAITDIQTGESIEDTYQYFYYVIDTAKGTSTATLYYALKQTPTTPVVQTVTLEKNADDWSSMVIDNATWAREDSWNSYYYNELNGIKRRLTHVSTDISEDTVLSFIQNRLPMEELN
ncbi:MAG: hypothetical protein IJW13_04485 [Clostridia bacterium]|nr:hypothetical protein [Clostridia bacterium]